MKIGFKFNNSFKIDKCSRNIYLQKYINEIDNDDVFIGTIINNIPYFYQVLGYSHFDSVVKIINKTWNVLTPEFIIENYEIPEKEYTLMVDENYEIWE